ncbi:copper transporter [Cellulomonas shaoxiangyii]|uniref:Copper transporter n=1 Tax=Cellulomonas shaoxiangyii TaxID=2566013 RepID=A0A4P7SKZ0_9CELL|nr:copper transporter [Cellulomonas shaoxiangyii]QCB93836.1 copper transporter [Cellulomonas shaoxiangyii]TGY84470.1 copper transporter [Cellulomonas shaoxiangyii]
MIDFRYHIVSLISVFLALAVGIALGAGPLKETIGDTLTGQVEQLRAEKEDLRAQLDAAAADQAAAEAIVSAAGERMLAGALADRRVALVLLDEVPEEQVTAIAERLGQAGASVSATVRLTDAWTDPALRSYRQALAGTLVSYLEPPPPADAGTEAELADALVQGLVGADATAPDVLSENAATLLELLSSGDNPLLAVTGEITTPADAVVVIAAPPVAQDEASPSAASTPTTQDAALAVIDAAQRLSTGAVLADGPRTPESLTSALLDDGDRAERVTTVSATDDVAGQVAVPLALAARIAGENGHYGYGDDLEPLPPAVQLPPVDRTPATVGDPAADAGAGTATEGATEGEG